MDIAPLKQQLDEHERQYQEWSEPINKATELHFEKMANRDGYTSEVLYGMFNVWWKSGKPNTTRISRSTRYSINCAPTI